MKISVITINYNNAQGLEKTIKSILAQTYKEYEYIVIDGGSTDGSKEIIEKYADKITYWVSEPDKGIFNAMNKGIVKATGEYLNFLNSGDIYANDNVLYNTFANQENKASVLIGTVIVDHMKRTYRRNIFPENKLSLATYLSHTINHQSTFIRRDLFSKYGSYDENLKIGGDWGFFLKVIYNKDPLYFLNFDVAVFNTEGISGKPENRDLLYNEKKQIIEKEIPAELAEFCQTIIFLHKHTDKYGEYFYMIDFVNNHKLPHLLFRGLNKLYKILNIK